jgi:hypothetical protein
LIETTGTKEKNTAREAQVYFRSACALSPSQLRWRRTDQETAWREGRDDPFKGEHCARPEPDNRRNNRVVKMPRARVFRLELQRAAAGKNLAVCI